MNEAGECRPSTPTATASGCSPPSSAGVARTPRTRSSSTTCRSRIAELDDTAVAERVAEVWAFWQRQRDHPRYRALVALLVETHAARSAELLDADTRRGAAVRARARREEREAARYALLDAAIARLVQRHGGVPRDKVAGLEEVGALGGLTPDEVTAAGAPHRLLGPAIGAEQRRQIRALLDEFGRLTGGPGARRRCSRCWGSCRRHRAAGVGRVDGLALTGARAPSRTAARRGRRAAGVRRRPPRTRPRRGGGLPRRRGRRRHRLPAAAGAGRGARRGPARRRGPRPPARRGRRAGSRRPRAAAVDRRSGRRAGRGGRARTARRSRAPSAAVRGQAPGAARPGAVDARPGGHGGHAADRAGARRPGAERPGRPSSCGRAGGPGAGRPREARGLVAAAAGAAGAVRRAGAGAWDEVDAVLADAAAGWARPPPRGRPPLGGRGRRARRLARTARTSSPDLEEPRAARGSQVGGPTSASRPPRRAGVRPEAALQAVLADCRDHRRRPAGLEQLTARPPDPPAWVNAARDVRGDVVVLWAPSTTGRVTYRVRRMRPDGTWQVIGRVPDSSIEDGGAPPGVEAPVYAVAAIQAGRSSTETRSDSAPAAPRPPPPRACSPYGQATARRGDLDARGGAASSTACAGSTAAVARGRPDPRHQDARTAARPAGACRCTRCSAARGGYGRSEGRSDGG